MPTGLGKIFMILLGLVTGLAIVEIGLRVFSPVELRLMGTEILLPYFRNYVVSVKNPRVLEPRIVHTKNALGFRGPDMPKPFEAQLSIVAFGGSTTECFILADGKDWPSVLQRDLERNFRDVWVNNAGQNGHTTLGHIRMMKQHVIKFLPKVVIFLIGLNDTSFEDNNARFDSKLDLSSKHNFFYRYWVAGKNWLSSHSHAMAFLYQTYRQWRASKVHDLGGLLEKDFVALAHDPPSDEDVQKWKAELEGNNYNNYLKRVNELVSLARDNGIEPVFITQPALAGTGRDPVTGLSLDRLMSNQTVKNQLLNEKLLEFGAKNNVLVVDAAAAMPRTSRHFYDLWHYTNEGSAALAKIVWSQLCPFLAERFPNHLVKHCGTGTLSTADN
jgi:lysophospholipase L1-like esterase